MVPKKNNIFSIKVKLSRFFFLHKIRRVQTLIESSCLFSNVQHRGPLVLHIVFNLIFKLRTEAYTFTHGLLTDSLTDSSVQIMLNNLRIPLRENTNKSVFLVVGPLRFYRPYTNGIVVHVTFFLVFFNSLKRILTIFLSSQQRLLTRAVFLWFYLSS